MAQFDLRSNAGSPYASEIPLLLEVQADLLDGLRSRVVVPLYRKPLRGRAISQLEPEVAWQGEPLVVATAELASVSVSSLGPVVGTLLPRRTELLAALDLLLTGI
jgi:toxin CcdB